MTKSANKIISLLLSFVMLFSTTLCFDISVFADEITEDTISLLDKYIREMEEKKYYVRIRTYKTVSGKKVYSSWSKAKTIKTK